MFGCDYMLNSATYCDLVLNSLSFFVIKMDILILIHRNVGKVK